MRSLKMKVTNKYWYIGLVSFCLIVLSYLFIFMMVKAFWKYFLNRWVMYEAYIILILMYTVLVGVPVCLLGLKRTDIFLMASDNSICQIKSTIAELQRLVEEEEKYIKNNPKENTFLDTKQCVSKNNVVVNSD